VQGGVAGAERAGEADAGVGEETADAAGQAPVGQLVVLVEENQRLELAVAPPASSMISL
jgi:hypothetical protein